LREWREKIFWGKSDSWQVCSGLPHKSGWDADPSYL
jgi:hypothetical protein